MPIWFRMSIDLDPVLEKKLRVAQLFVRAKKYRDAIETYLEITESEPNKSEYYKVIGELYYNSSDYTQAEYYFSESMKLGSDKENEQFLAFSKIMLHKYREAEELLSKINENDEYLTNLIATLNLLTSEPDELTDKQKERILMKDLLAMYEFNHNRPLSSIRIAHQIESRLISYYTLGVIFANIRDESSTTKANKYFRLALAIYEKAKLDEPTFLNKIKIAVAITNQNMEERKVALQKLMHQIDDPELYYGYLQTLIESKSPSSQILETIEKMEEYRGDAPDLLRSIDLWMERTNGGVLY